MTPIPVALVIATTLLLALPSFGPGQPPSQPGPANRDLPPGALARLGVPVVGSRAYVSGLALAPDGKTLALAEDRTTVQLLSTTTGKELRRFTIPDLGATHLAFTPDGRGLACAAHRGPVRVFAAATGKQTAHYGDAEWLVGSLIFSTDGAALAAGNDTFAEKPMPLPVWDTRTGQLLARVEPVQNFRVGGALSPDGRTLASWGQYFSPDRKDPAAEQERGRTVQLWDVRTGKELRRLNAGAAVARAAFTPDGQTLAIATETAVMWWNPVTGKEVRDSFVWRAETVSLLFAPDGRTLAAAARDGTVARWPAAGGKPLISSWAPPGSAPHLASDADGRLVACWLERQRPVVWDVVAEKSLLEEAGHRAPVTGVYFTAQPGQLHSVDSEGTVLLWDVRTPAVVRHARLLGTRRPHVWYHGRHDDIVFSPDGRYLLGRLADPRLERLAAPGTRVWDSATGKGVCDLAGVPGRWGIGGPAGGKPVVVTSDGLRRNAVLSVWEVPTGRLVRSFQQCEDSSVTALSPDGKMLALTTRVLKPGDTDLYRELVLAELATGKLLHRVGARLFPIAFSPDGETLLASDLKGFVQIAVAAGKEVRRFGDRLDLPSVSVAFSPCGRLVACTAALNAHGAQVQVIELATGSPRFLFSGYSPVHSLAFSPNGKTLATGGQDGSILLWDLAGRGREGALTPHELEANWTALTDADGQKGWQAMRRLADAPRDCVPFLGARLKPLYSDTLPDESTLKDLLVRLDGADFKEREKASQNLAGLGRAVKPFLLKTLKDRPSLEVRRRLEKLLEGLNDYEATADELRQLRALEILERIGTEEARRVAAQLTEERAGNVVSRAARADLARWKKTAP